MVMSEQDRAKLFFALQHHFVSSLRYVIRLLRSTSFLSPAKAILVPGMYFLGFSRYSKRVSSLQVTPSEKRSNEKRRLEKSQYDGVDGRGVRRDEAHLVDVGLGVREALDGAGLAAEETVEVGADCRDEDWSGMVQKGSERTSATMSVGH